MIHEWEEQDDRTVGLDYKAEYERSQCEIRELNEKIERMKIEFAMFDSQLDRMRGAIRIIEMLTGKEFRY